MEKNYEYRFELRPGKYVYIPTAESMSFGNFLVGAVNKRWLPADYFYHFGKRGGHLAALRPHLKQQYRASIDIRSFFGTVSRTKVQRSLKRIGFSNRPALDFATKSCVVQNGRKFLPYGFVQSMQLATLAFEKSFAGIEVNRIRASGVSLTMYVDDIILSADDYGILSRAFENLQAAIVASGFEVSPNKLSPPNTEVEAFNCQIERAEMHISVARLGLFKEQLKDASELGKASILRYVGVVDDEQRKFLESL